MHLSASRDDELATLVEMVSLAAEVASSQPRRHRIKQDTARFEGVESKVLEVGSKHAGLAGMDRVRPCSVGKNRVTEKVPGKRVLPAHASRRSATPYFWEELMIRLAERDLIQGDRAQQPSAATQRRSPPQKSRAPREKRYWAKFQKDGISPTPSGWNPTKTL